MLININHCRDNITTSTALLHKYRNADVIIHIRDTMDCILVNNSRLDWSAEIHCKQSLAFQSECDLNDWTKHCSNWSLAFPFDVN